MDLRTELMPPILDTSKMEQLARLTNQIMGAITYGQDTEPLIADFNAIAGCQCTRADFDAVQGSTHAYTFVQEMLSNNPQHVEDITEAELLELTKCPV